MPMRSASTMAGIGTQAPIARLAPQAATATAAASAKPGAARRNASAGWAMVCSTAMGREHGGNASGRERLSPFLRAGDRNFPPAPPLWNAAASGRLIAALNVRLWSAVAARVPFRFVERVESPPHCPLPPFARHDAQVLRRPFRRSHCRIAARLACISLVVYKRRRLFCCTAALGGLALPAGN